MIRLLNVGYKICARILNKRLKIITEILIAEEQNGFRTGHSTIDNVFFLPRISEERREFSLQIHVVFIDLRTF